MLLSFISSEGRYIMSQPMLQKADAEAAKLYEDFVESFAEDPAEKGPKAFVRGEVIQPGQRPADSGFALELLQSLAACHLFTLGLISEVSLCLGEAPRRAGKYVPKFLPPAMAQSFAAPEARPTASEVAWHLASSNLTWACCQQHYNRSESSL